MKTKAKASLLEAARPAYGSWPESDWWIAGRAYLRLVDAGWVFDLHAREDAVWVHKPGGAERHVVSEVCDCDGWRWKGTCYHRSAVVLCGGVVTLRERIQGQREIK